MSVVGIIELPALWFLRGYILPGDKVCPKMFLNIWQRATDNLAEKEHENV